MKRLHNKLYNWEAAPPPQSWDRISRALDESELQAQFPKRLRAFDAVPSSDAWSRIAANLESAQTANLEAVPANNDSEFNAVVPMRRRWTVWMRYAAAILLLMASAWGIREWMNRPQTATQLPVAVQETPADTTPKTNELAAAGPHVTNPDSARSFSAPAENNGLRSAGNQLAHYASEAPVLINNNADQAIYEFEDRQPKMAHNYLTLLTADGSFIRMSKKWSDLVCCIAGEDENAGCQQQLKTWQDQLASSPVAPGPGGFLDIIDLVNSLSEGTQL